MDKKKMDALQTFHFLNAFCVPGFALIQSAVAQFRALLQNKEYSIFQLTGYRSAAITKVSMGVC